MPLKYVPLVLVTLEIDYDPHTSSRADTSDRRASELDERRSIPPPRQYKETHEFPPWKSMLSIRPTSAILEGLQPPVLNL